MSHMFEMCVYKTRGHAHMFQLCGAAIDELVEINRDSMSVCSTVPNSTTDSRSIHGNREQELLFDVDLIDLASQRVAIDAAGPTLHIILHAQHYARAV